jgi:hypothetical protein
MEPWRRGATAEVTPSCKPLEESWIEDDISLRIEFEVPAEMAVEAFEPDPPFREAGVTLHTPSDLEFRNVDVEDRDLLHVARAQGQSPNWQCVREGRHRDIDVDGVLKITPRAPIPIAPAPVSVAGKGQLTALCTDETNREGTGSPETVAQDPVAYCKLRARTFRDDNGFRIETIGSRRHDAMLDGVPQGIPPPQDPALVHRSCHTGTGHG